MLNKYHRTITCHDRHKSKKKHIGYGIQLSGSVRKHIILQNDIEDEERKFGI